MNNVLAFVRHRISGNPPIAQSNFIAAHDCIIPKWIFASSKGFRIELWAKNVGCTNGSLQRRILPNCCLDIYYVVVLTCVLPSTDILVQFLWHCCVKFINVFVSLLEGCLIQTRRELLVYSTIRTVNGMVNGQNLSNEWANMFLKLNRSEK